MSGTPNKNISIINIITNIIKNGDATLFCDATLFGGAM